MIRSLYPDLPGPRLQALARDALTLLLLATFAWLGLRVKHDVDRLAVLGVGVVDAGSGIRSGFLSAASAAGNIPLAGDAISGALRSAAASTGGSVIAVGRAGVNGAHHLGTILGLLIWGIPSLLLLALILPRRWRESRDLRELRRALSSPDAAARQRLLALRAAVNMPDEVLFAYSADPAGDLLAGRYEPLAAAALEAGGVNPASGSAHTT
jgi:hypothetical protein